ncbi:hypothetical protein EYZ11_004109 [Aspergillus tanneri]|uniref:Amidase domain-containing protein n=1 Tax=Aspergillus tanneri TaxID=1220188 RepID=A0A4S3JLM7_9EURO|nr:uncharacterized protein ATNIH1004_005769 [Aspergillus tanneri]KAA8647086.1 hypothetical protein ATNIH1004_005769 [Aspergillus tanneri]THC96412.1 hypothetical protein EYZ11_004109 [Aspergillus tanneri]
MSVLFTSISQSNPVKKGEVQQLLQSIGVSVEPDEEDDFQTLLAALHDCAETVSRLPDYQPVPDLNRYPRQNIRRPTPDEQVLGQAWAHRFLIQGNPDGGILAGKTISLKDCIAVAGVPQLLGSDVIPSWTPVSDATVVTRVLDAGADILGTSTCENFCHSTSSFTSAQGTVENPFASGYSAGGSTSGGAALVGAGLVDITIGGDQGGSVRVPASFCGCVGFKPTYGLVPYSGITSGDAVNDHTGPLARNVLDVALCLDSISGYDGMDDRSLGSPPHGSTTYAQALQTGPTRLEGFKIGILAEGFEQEIVDPVVKSTVWAAACKFTDLGATVDEVSLPEHLHGPAIWTIQQRIAGSQNLLGHAHGRRGLSMTEMDRARLPWTNESFQRAFPSTKNVLINGMYLTARFPDLYSKTNNWGRKLRDRYNELFTKYDLVVMPTTPVVAPRHGKWGLPIDSIRPSMGLTINTAIFNVTGHPAMSLPVGFAPSPDDPQIRLPVGMQIVGGWWKESEVLRAGHVWETHFNWKDTDL